MSRGVADSSRWCEKCQAWGDHHSDRHEQFVPAPGQEGRA